jgi:hypothetical protein
MLDNSPFDPYSVEYAVYEIINRILSQPELNEHWNEMANAEKNYFIGDIYNIIDKVKR